MKIYGKQVSEVQEIKIDKIKGRHKMNFPRKESLESKRVLKEDITEQGINEPVLLTREGEILRGGRRWEAARKAGLKTIPGRYIQEGLTEKDLRRIIFRDNNIRENYSWEEQKEIIRKLYGKARIMQNVAGKFADRSQMELSLERVIEDETGIGRSMAKKALVELRTEYRQAEMIDLGTTILTPQEQNWAARHLKAIIDGKTKIQQIKGQVAKSETELYQIIPSSRVKGKANKLKTILRELKRGKHKQVAIDFERNF